MNYKQLQKWAQARGIKANQKKEILQKHWDRITDREGFQFEDRDPNPGNPNKGKNIRTRSAFKSGSYKKGYAAPGLDAVSSAGLPLTGEISTGRSAVQNRINRTTGVGGIPFGPLSKEDYLRGLPTDPASRKVRRRRDVPLSQGSPPPPKYPYPHGPPRSPSPQLPAGAGVAASRTSCHCGCNCGNFCCRSKMD